jgi:hypothetical protein
MPANSIEYFPVWRQGRLCIWLYHAMPPRAKQFVGKMSAKITLVVTCLGTVTEILKMILGGHPSGMLWLNMIRFFRRRRWKYLSGQIEVGFLDLSTQGIFIRDFLLGLGLFGSPAIDPERGAPIEDIRFHYKDCLLRACAEDMVAMAMEEGIELTLEEVLRGSTRGLPK